MAKNLTPPAIIDGAVRDGVVPGEAQVSPKGEARWSRTGLSYLLRVERRPDGSFAWHLYVGDEKFGPAMKDYGSLSIMIRTVGDPSIPWPTDSDQGFAEAFHGELREAVRFVDNRADLARIFAADSDVCRGSLYAWLPSGNLASRLVQSVVVARDMGDEMLAEEALSKLRSGILVASYGREVDILVSAKEWAKRYSKALGFKVEL